MQFLPLPPQEALRTGTEMWLSENRWVACVFFNFRQLEAESFGPAQEVVSALMALLHKHEGDLHQLVCDEKGTTAVGLWGTPPHSHPDDPIFAARCAVDAAREVGQLLRGAGLGAISAGISVGRAFCGNIGSVSRCEFSLIGDVMNMAARLAGAAAKLKEEVLCDEHCAQFVADAGDRAGVVELRTHDLTLKNVDRVVVASVLGPAPPPVPGSQRSFSRMRWGMASTRSIGGASAADLESLDEDSASGAAGDEREGGSAAGGRRAPSLRSGGGSFRTGAAGGGTAAAASDAEERLRTIRASNASEGASMYVGGIYGMESFRTRGRALFGRDESLNEVVRLVGEANAGPNGGGRLLITVTGAMSMGKTSFLKVAALAVIREHPEQCCLFLTPGRAGTDTETPFHSWRCPWFRHMCERHAPSVPERLRPYLPLLDDIFNARPGSAAGGATFGGGGKPGSSSGAVNLGYRSATSDTGAPGEGGVALAPSGASFSGAVERDKRSTADNSSASVEDSATARDKGPSDRGGDPLAPDGDSMLRGLSAEEHVRWAIALATEIVAMEADMADLPLLIIAVRGAARSAGPRGAYKAVCRVAILRTQWR